MAMEFQQERMEGRPSGFLRIARCTDAKPYLEKNEMNDITDGLVGWVLVPKVATNEMEQAGEAITINCIPADVPDAGIIYSAMIAAAPAPDKLEAGERAADTLVTIARIIARNIDDERFYSAAPFQRAALEIYTAHIEATASQLAAVEAENTRLRGKIEDLAEYEGNALNERDDAISRATDAHSQLKAAMDRIKVLEGALTPFDIAASALFTRSYNNTDVVAALPIDASHPQQLRLVAKDFFSVRTALFPVQP